MSIKLNKEICKKCLDNWVSYRANCKADWKEALEELYLEGETNTVMCKGCKYKLEHLVIENKT